jgi:hypothetical protein
MSCCELVDVNAPNDDTGCSCGDFVDDTAADIGTGSTIAPNCTWIIPSLTVISSGNNMTCYQGQFPNFVDENGNPYSPNPTNIMSATNSTLECRFAFTDGQGVRMRYFLETSPTLADATLNTAPLIGPEISGFEVWSDPGDIFIEGTLTIKTGAYLRIESGVIARFEETGKVIIEPGAQLELYGTLTSNNCGTYWKGIEVWGNSNQSQYPINGFPLL